jgi:6-phosphogluconolactonase (cycloisomerase 2 family)
MRRVGAVFGICGLALAAAPACGGAPPRVLAGRPAAPLPAPAPPPSCARSRADVVATPPRDLRTSSTVAIVRLGDRTLAYVADEDTEAVRTVDVDSGREVASTPLGSRPSQLLVLPDGRVIVGLRDSGRVAVFEPGAAPERPLEARCAVDVAPEPLAMALSPDDATLFVSSGWGRALGAYDATAELHRRYEIPLPREPRAVVVSDDGRVAFVTHAVGGTLSRVDLEATGHPATDILLHAPGPEQKAQEQPPTSGRAAGKTRRIAQHMSVPSPASCQGYALAKTEEPSGRLLAPQVLVDPGSAERVPSGYGNDSQNTEEPDVAVVDVATGKPFEASLSRDFNFFIWDRRGGEAERNAQSKCLLPRAAAYDNETRSLLVTCLGADAVVAFDALAARPAGAEKRRWLVPAGPTGVAVDAPRHRAVVWSQFERVVSVLKLDAPEVPTDKPPSVERIALAPDAAHRMPEEVALGRVLFHAVGDGRISSDGRACASCHPDGRDDALVWATPEGPRRSIMLAGRLKGTAPYSWEGDEKALDEHLGITFERLHGAGGLRSIELSALSAYVNALRPPATPGVPPEDVGRVGRGEELFRSAAVGCSDCHSGAAATDNMNHDIQSKTRLDRSGLFNTPSLHLVGGTGPFFHDGRFATLRDLLTKTSGTMGDTAQLSKDDLDALEAYVRTR